jgi:transposase-like protein
MDSVLTDIFTSFCPLPYVEELMEERGVDVDHSTINQWTIKYSPLLEEAFHRRKRSV